MTNILNKLLFLEISSECSFLNVQEYELITTLLTIVRVTVPIILIILVIKDFMSASMAGNEEDVKKAQKAAITRIIIAVIIFFLPTIVNLIFTIVSIDGFCKVGW